MAMVEYDKEVVWLCGLVIKLEVSQNQVELHCDNQSDIHLAKNQAFDVRTKHIDVRYHKIREIINDGLVSLVKIYIDDNAADIFTRPMTLKKFRHCLGFIGVSHCQVIKSVAHEGQWSCL